MWTPIHILRPIGRRVGAALVVALLTGGVVLAPGASAQGGGLLVFQAVSGGPIYAVNADGSPLARTGDYHNLRYLTTGMDPALSPDGQWVAFTRWDDTQSGALGSLWVIRVDGSGERAVLGEIHQPKSPTWSPDGTQIVVGMQHGGRVKPERECSGQRPPRDAIDVEVKREIENDGDVDVTYCYTLVAHPYWGLRLVDEATGEFEDLRSNLFSYSPSWDPTNNWHVVYDSEGGLMSLDLNRDATWEITRDVNDHSPAVSPDGSKVAVSYWQHDHWEVHVLNADGSGRVRLTETSARAAIEQMINGETPKSWNNASPVWSPDGSQIAFLTDRSGGWEIWVINADGSNQHVLLSRDVLTGLNLQYNGMDERMLSWQ